MTLCPLSVVSQGLAGKVPRPLLGRVGAHVTSALSREGDLRALPQGLSVVPVDGDTVRMLPVGSCLPEAAPSLSFRSLAVQRPL